jgi:uncharacterized protein GlcG (DUF336 family)
VLDAGGRVKAFQKQDGLMRFEIAYGNAFAALALNRSSRQMLQKAKEKEKPAFIHSLGELADGPIFLEAGGQLIRDAS